MIGYCINCDKKILDFKDGKWEDIEYHSITFMKKSGSYLRLSFCKQCHDEFGEVNYEELRPKILKHVESVVRKQLEPFINMELVSVVTKDGPLDEEDRKNGVQVVY
jgi:hypothetical protein